MVVEGDKHFYIYEIVQLNCGLKFIPCFFYQTEDGLMAKCICPMIDPIPDSDEFEIGIPPEPVFDSLDFKSIRIEQFSKTFDEIEMDMGVNLKDCCGSEMFRKQIVNKRFIWCDRHLRPCF